ncbi:hypothetical protein A2625_01125 [candidate division WOR-1 bacterium RIFCSPHIGHO2_01_FULL_53_15]|uniref:Uncharacterized protein n=1 Tax=candidate division WOR-1 bacterium RIFCSPHIGHO2_01_FULL_53_15 TaxID=1802564 RepID=A0A1F4Q0F8_UNCSA|nr:MAG: hypothetical protein A2625_01125 [candidate division WOR-1 bacterium RIFCSPHIGHO2_01_FULL_53_15]OGC10750.1 MAG: hypothetical protein A3D23_04635 [candidate division WOR-1 bacterium RIFCSPHIGHO2_02_FULL_53_26]
MWQFAGTLAVSAFGGAFLIHYLTNFLLTEKAGFVFDWDGVVERGLITFLIMSQSWLFLIPAIIALKILFRLAGLSGLIFKTSEPGLAAQKVKLKAELALELFVSPVFAILVGIVF